MRLREVLDLYEGKADKQSNGFGRMTGKTHLTRLRTNMTYKDLVKDIARRSGLSAKDVRAVLSATPDALLELEVGEHVRTPLGTFRMAKRQHRNIKLPEGFVAEVDEMDVVRLKPGIRVKKTSAQTPSQAHP